LPAVACSVLCVLIGCLKDLDAKIGVLDTEIARRAREDGVARRLTSIPGIGPITATAIAALASPVEHSSAGEILQPGLGSRHGSAQLVANKNSAQP
jgi:transposase